MATAIRQSIHQTPAEMNIQEEEFEMQTGHISSGGAEKPTVETGSTGDANGLPEVGTHPGDSAESLEGAYQPPQVGKPQVIVRIRPSPILDSAPTFEVDQQSKTIQIRVDRSLRGQQLTKHKPPPGFIYFPSDSVLENSSQEDTFTTVAVELVEKAMMGIPGMIVAIGPEASGKSFSLFGLSGRYRNRGIVARALEKMFEIKDRKAGETDFKFAMGIIEVRRERIRDLLTLSPNEINDVGEKGPRGMYIENVDCMEHGLGLLLRALIGQKLIHQEPYEKSHTIVYFEIVGVSPLASELVQFQSRITIAEIASAPNRTDTNISNNPNLSLFYGPNACVSPSPSKADTQKFKLKQAVFPPRTCCNPGQTTGPLAESIAVRRDIFALEQIFLKANEMYRIRKYFHKLENLGLSMIASEKRKLASGNNFRQNRLAHCLKDILDTSTEMRILLHVRPDKAYLKSSLEAMRFAERARLVPSNLYDSSNKRKLSRTEDQILQEVITDIAPDLMHPANVESLNSEKMRVIQDQAVHYFENNIDAMKVCSKEKVKLMFENFRVLWNFLWELELNVTLRKAEEDMKATMEKMGMGTVAGRSLGGGDHAPTKILDRHGRKESIGKKGSGGSGGGAAAAALVSADADEEEAKEATRKKSSRKTKKDKEKERKKKRHQSKRLSITDVDEIILKPDETKILEDGKRPTNVDGVVLGAAREDNGQTSHIPPDNASGNDGIKGETEVSNTSPPATNEFTTVSANDNLEISNAIRKSGDMGDTSSKKISLTANRPENTSTVGAGDYSLGDDSTNARLSLNGEAAETPNSNGDSTNNTKLSNERVVTVSIQPTVANNSPQSPHSPPVRHNSTFFVRGGFADFKLHNVWGASQDQKTLTEEERQQLAVQQELQISNNFEEMKKIARRQAIHLLRTGIRRPQWLTLF